MDERTDRQILADVTDHLRRDARVNVQDLGVALDGGTVTLSGAVPSPLARRAAEEAARRVAGVRGVENFLRIAPGPAQTPASDEHLLADARQVLEWSADIDTGAVGIGVSGGTIILTGTVDEPWKRDHAAALVAALAGVIGVDNRLEVRPAPSRRADDRTVEEEIRGALARSITIDADGVEVHAEDGLVTLTGRVPNALAREEASHAAFFTRGVVAVRNQIEVTPPTPPTPHAAAAAAAARGKARAEGSRSARPKG